MQPLCQTHTWAHIPTYLQRSSGRRKHSLNLALRAASCFLSLADKHRHAQAASSLTDSFKRTHMLGQTTLSVSLPTYLSTM